MAGKRGKPEDVVTKARQIEVLQGQGMSIADAVWPVGTTQQTYQRWRKLYGGIGRARLKRLKEPEQENQHLRRAVSELTLDRLILTEAARAEPLSPSRRRRCIDHVPQTPGVSARRACHTSGQHRSTQRKVPRGRSDEGVPTEDIIELARKYGRYALPGSGLLCKP